MFAKNQTVRPVDQILKGLTADEIDIKKAMLYSAGSTSFKEAMGPCSWINKLPEQKEIYYSKEAYKNQKIFPDQIEKSMKDLSDVQMTSDVDYVVMLPLNLSKEYFVKTLNKGKTLPRRFKLKKQMSTKAIDVPLNLKTNASTLGVSFGQESLSSQCIHFCSDKDLNSEYLISDIIILKPTIKCQPYHPSRTGGASYAPEYQANYELTLDCYCTK